MHVHHTEHIDFCHCNSDLVFTHHTNSSSGELVQYLGEEVVVQEDVGRARQDGIGGGVLDSGLQEGVWGEPGNTDIAELWLQVNDSHCHLRREGREEERKGEEGRKAKGKEEGREGGRARI